jgi:hypothetical protein
VALSTLVVMVMSMTLICCRLKIDLFGGGSAWLS